MRIECKKATAFLSFTLAACCVGQFCPAYSQPPSHYWSRSFGEEREQFATDIAVDAGGNVVMTGMFLGSVDFGGGTLSSAGGRDIYVAKFGPSGGHLWSKRFGDSADQYSYAIDVGDAGDVVIGGFFDGTIDFGGGPLASIDDNDSFVAAFSSSGSYLWSHTFGDSSPYTYADGLAIDHMSNTWVVGTFYGTVDFGGGPLTSTGFPDVFVAKLGPTGEHLWSQSYGDSRTLSGGVGVDHVGNGVVGGYFEGTIDFGGDPFVSAGDFDGFLAKLDQDGNHIWSITFGDHFEQKVYDVAIDESDNVLITGYLQGTADLGGGPLTEAGSGDVLIAKFTAGGTHVWSDRFGDGAEQEGWYISTGPSGRTLASGGFRGTIDFGGGPMTFQHDDIYVVMFDSIGGHIWSERYASSNAGVDYTEAGGVAMDNWGSSIFAATYWGTIDLGGGSLVSNSYDICLAKLGPAASGVTNTPRTKEGLVRVYPNPFSGGVSIEYELQSQSSVTLTIYDAAGRRVVQRRHAFQPAGRRTLTWNGLDDRGHGVVSGVYFIRLEAAGVLSESRVVVLK